MRGKRMFARCTLLALLIGLVAGSYAFAEFYKYRDKDGVLRFTDNLGEVPADQRPKMKRYQGVKSEPRPAGQTRPGKRKKAPAKSAPQPKNKVQIEAQRLVQEQRDLDKVYRKLMNEKMTLANRAQSIQTPEEVKNYRRDLQDFNRRIENFEKRRYRYLNRASILKDEIEKEKQRQNRPQKAAGPPKKCRDCDQKATVQ